MSQPVTTARDNPALPLPAKTIYQFNQTPTWIENIAVRSNGNLLVTILTPAPQLWQIAEPWSDEPQAELVYTFPDLSGLVGITETAPDTFVLAGANFTASPIISAVWEVAFSPGSGDPSATTITITTPRKIADLPGAGVVNGVTAVPGCGKNSIPKAVLVADSARGLVFRVDIATGAVATAVSVPEMAPITTAASPVGINGIKIRDGYLYFDNSYAVTLYRVPINASGFAAPDAVVETVAQIEGETFLDDFIFDQDSEADAVWIASNHGNTVRRIDLATDKSSVVVAGALNQTTVLGSTAAQFGRTEGDRRVLYVTTSGVNVKTPVEPGKVVAIDTAGFW